jgi:hypothetical protein
MATDLRLGVLAACRAALRPLVRMLLKQGVMHRDFVELSKDIYVDVARREYGIRGRPTNVSRTALLTGLDRKEITRIKNRLDAVADESPRKQDRIARLLSGWHQDPDYLRRDGTPMMLPLEGPAPSYETLVKRYAGDVPGITILRELERTGAVQVHSDSAVEVLRRNYRLDTVEPEALVRAGSVLADIGETVTHNLYRDASAQSRFEARATNVRVPRSAMPAYRELVYRECQAFLEKIDAWLTAHELPEDETAPTQRVGLGIYWIQSTAATEERS